MAHDFTDDVTIEDAHVEKGECNMGKSVTRKDVLPPGSQWLMKGVEKSRKLEKSVDRNARVEILHPQRTRGSTEVRQGKPHAEAACGALARGGAEDTQA